MMALIENLLFHEIPKMGPFDFVGNNSMSIQISILFFISEQTGALPILLFGVVIL
jgi:hypothetical protein